MGLTASFLPQDFHGKAICILPLGALNIMIDSGLTGASPATKLLQKAKGKVTAPAMGRLAPTPSQLPAYFCPPSLHRLVDAAPGRSDPEAAQACW